MKGKNFLFKILSSYFINESVKAQEYGWSGNYSSWEAAANECQGYDAENILERVKDSMIKIKNGEAVYERDSVLFNKVEYSWGLLSGILMAAAENKGQLEVIDFGGSLGSTYFQNLKFLKNIKNLNWTVVEQAHFVACGKELFSDDTLKFENEISEAISNKKSPVLILSSVLQYLENAHDFIREIMQYRFPFILIDRTAFISGKSERIMLQRVPPEIYEASYPTRFFSEHDFLSNFYSDYELMADFASFSDGSQKTDDGRKLYWKGFILRRKI